MFAMIPIILIWSPWSPWWVIGNETFTIEYSMQLEFGWNLISFPYNETIDKTDLLQYVSPEDIKSVGLIPELIGGLPVFSHLKPLDRSALRRILTEPKNALVKQYFKLFEIDGVKLEFDKEVLDFIVDKAVEYKLGARGLRSICETIMMDAMFELPSSSEKEQTFVVSKEYASEKLSGDTLKNLKVA